MGAFLFFGVYVFNACLVYRIDALQKFCPWSALTSQMHGERFRYHELCDTCVRSSAPSEHALFRNTVACRPCCAHYPAKCLAVAWCHSCWLMRAFARRTLLSYPSWTCFGFRFAACRWHLPCLKVMHYVTPVSVTLHVIHAPPTSVLRHLTVFPVDLPPLTLCMAMWHACVALSWLCDDTDDRDMSVIWCNPKSGNIILRDTCYYLIFWNLIINSLYLLH